MAFSKHTSAPDPLRRRRAGFTLLEVMLSTLITAFVFAGVMSAYIFLGRALMRTGNSQSLESETRTTLYYFTQDVGAATGVVSGSFSSTGLELSEPNAITVTYTYSAGTGQLTRTSSASANTRVMLTHINTFAFSYFDFSGIATSNPNAVKQISMSYQTRAGYNADGTASGAQATFDVVSPRVMLKNRTFLK